MPINIATYNPQQTLVHAVDARVKIILVFAYSIALFCVHSWWGIGLLAALAFCIALLSRLNAKAALKTMLPLSIILVVTLVANSFVLDVRSYDPATVPGAVSSGIFATAPAIPLVGAFGFAPAGFARGCYYVLRIVLLLVASLVLTTTTSSTEITGALESFLKPLKALGVPTQDIATVVSIALRFIPVSIDEFQMLRIAQTARGARFDTGGIIQRLRSWVTVLIPLFVGLYRRADSLALAMDARCYGSSEATHLSRTALTAIQLALLLAGLVVCCTIAVFG